MNIREIIHQTPDEGHPLISYINVTVVMTICHETKKSIKLALQHIYKTS